MDTYVLYVPYVRPLYVWQRPYVQVRTYGTGTAKTTGTAMKIYTYIRTIYKIHHPQYLAVCSVSYHTAKTIATAIT